ncbi:MAG: hypothetical protein K6A70_00230 [Erysipelotrichaceae bacterium]|nr:hypothetical protein [Erysipelotrichaceae bacterium]
MNRDFLIEFNRKRSIMALLAAIVGAIFYHISIYGGIVMFAEEKISFKLFRYFTIVSGVYGLIVMIMLIPFAINGLINKRFTYNRWMAMLHYSTAICTSVVFVFALCFISFYDPILAFGGYNFNLHFICPVMILVAFLTVESATQFTIKDSLICIIPIIVYSLIYFYNVVVVHNWEDFYNFNTYLPFYISMPLIYLFVFLIADVLRRLNNIKNRYVRKSLTKSWDNDVDAVSIKIDLYGLGRYVGLHGESNSINLNFDVLTTIAGAYDIKMEELTNAYTKGVIDGQKEKQKKPET